MKLFTARSINKFKMTTTKSEACTYFTRPFHLLSTRPGLNDEAWQSTYRSHLALTGFPFTCMFWKSNTTNRFSEQHLASPPKKIDKGSPPTLHSTQKKTKSSSGPTIWQKSGTFSKQMLPNFQIWCQTSWKLYPLSDPSMVDPSARVGSNTLAEDFKSSMNCKHSILWAFAVSAIIRLNDAFSHSLKGRFCQNVSCSKKKCKAEKRYRKSVPLKFWTQNCHACMLLYSLFRRNRRGKLPFCAPCSNWRSSYQSPQIHFLWHEHTTLQLVFKTLVPCSIA